MLRVLRVALIGTAVLSVSPALAAAASGGSVVFVREGDLFRVSADGSLIQELTTVGTPRDPFRSPSQTDAGEVVALHRGAVVRFAPNGTPLPAPGLPADGSEAQRVAASPDGAAVAVLVRGGCASDPADPDPQGCRRVLVIPMAGGDAAEVARGHADVNGVAFTAPDRLLVTRGGRVDEITLTPAGPAVRAVSPDESGSAVLASPDGAGAGIAVERQDGSGQRTLRLYGDATATTPAAVRCDVGGTGTARPTLSPDGTQLVWQTSFGIVRTAIGANGCPSATAVLLAVGGSDPDWGPAGLSRAVATAVRPRTSVTRPGRVATQVAIVNVGPGLRLTMRLRVAGRVTVKVDHRIRGGVRTVRRLAVARRAGRTAFRLGRLAPGVYRVRVTIGVRGAGVATLPPMRLVVRMAPRR